MDLEEAVALRQAAARRGDSKAFTAAYARERHLRGRTRAHNAQFESEHPRAAKGRIGGGRFADKPHPDKAPAHRPQKKKPPPSNLGKARMGAQDDGAVLHGGTQLDEAIRRARAIGAGRWRVIVDGAKGLDAYAAGIARVQAEGFKVQLTLTNYQSPDFVAGAMHRWPQTAAWSFWNEPELTLMRNDGGPGAYAAGWRHYYRIHRAGYKLARQLVPQAKVLIGEVSSHAKPIDIRHLSGLPGDGIAIHPYQFATPPSRRDPTLTTGIGSLGVVGKAAKPKPIYITEFGFPSGRAPVKWWKEALRQARKHHVRSLVVYQMTPDMGHADRGTKRWDTNPFDANGRLKPGAEGLAP